MAEPLSAAEERQYTDIIDSILATADLNTVTRKKIRAGLETALGGKDLSDQKTAIKNLIEERFDRVTGSPQEDDATPSGPVQDSPDDDDAKFHVNGRNDEDEVPPARKKQKREESVEDADAKLAAQLQAQENNMSRTRTTRGGSVTKKRKAPRKKSSKKVHGDSDVDGSEDPAPKRKAGGGFQKPFTLSYPLAQLVGEPQLSRPQVVKKLWEHIKSNELQDPSDKRQIQCDDMMREVFKQSKVDMFQMNKMIGSHLYPVEEES